MKIVLQKFIAEAGVCSRRKAEELIKRSVGVMKNAPVLVNGKAPELGMKVDSDDEVIVFGQKIGLKEKKIYIMLNKPKGYTCTSRKFKGEENVFDLVRIDERLFVVGRLDKDSRGLVLLTNDGELTQRLTHPKFEHEKKYLVRITNNPSYTKASAGKQETITKQELSNILLNFKKGINIGEGDGMVKVKSIKYLDNRKFDIVLTEGKKRQIRRMFGAGGYRVEDILRVRVGNLQLGDLIEGGWRYLTNEEIKKL